MPTKEKNRIEFIDLAKGVCIFLVVFVHVMPELGAKFDFLGCLRMPLYFCLSGLFYKNYGGFRNFSIKKVNNILIPFLAWYAIGYGIYYLGRTLMQSGNDATFHFWDILVQNEIFNLPIWFLLCLFWSNLLFSGVNALASKWYSQLSLVMAIAAVGLLANEAGVFNFVYFFSSMTCLPFFYLGFALKQTALLYPNSDKKKDFIIMAACLGVASLLAFIPDYPPRFNFYRNEIAYGNVVAIYICAALMVIGVLILCKFVKHIPFITWIGRYSIIVLVTHMWLRDILNTFVGKVAGASLSTSVKEVIVLCLVMASMFAIIPLCKRYLPYITAQKPLLKTGVGAKESGDKSLKPEVNQ